MDPKPISIVIDEVRSLLNSLEAGTIPKNKTLNAAVWRACRDTRPDMEPKPTLEAIMGF